MRRDYRAPADLSPRAGAPVTAASDLLLDRLREVTGKDGVELNPPDPTAGLAPRARVTPASAQEIAGCLNVASRAGAAVAPWGGGTQQRLGSAPSRLDMTLHTSRLDAVVEWEPADLTA